MGIPQPANSPCQLYSPPNGEKPFKINGENKFVLHCDSGLTLACMTALSDRVERMDLDCERGLLRPAQRSASIASGGSRERPIQPAQGVCRASGRASASPGTGDRGGKGGTPLARFPPNKTNNSVRLLGGRSAAPPPPPSAVPLPRVAVRSQGVPPSDFRRCEWGTFWRTPSRALRFGEHASAYFALCAAPAAGRGGGMWIRAKRVNVDSWEVNARCRD
jgi:hypothetical protein